jgi:hypothetical protein
MLIINAVIFNLACKITDFLKKKGQIGTFNIALSVFHMPMWKNV